MAMFDNLFGGLFDFNGDGKTTMGEKLIAHNIFQEIEKEDKKSDRIFPDDDSEDSDSWHAWCEDASEYDISPEDYETEEEYEDALEEAKNDWHECCEDGSECDISAENYETVDEDNEDLYKNENDNTSSSSTTLSIPIKLMLSVECSNFDKSDANKKTDYLNKQQTVLKERNVEEEKADSERRIKKQMEKDKARCKTPSIEIDQSILDDKNIYIYCGVVFNQNNYVYHYRTDDNTLKVGDCVIVPYGSDSYETKATIVSVGQYTRLAVPFPLEKTKFIIKRAEEQ